MFCKGQFGGTPVPKNVRQAKRQTETPMKDSSRYELICNQCHKHMVVSSAQLQTRLRSVGLLKRAPAEDSLLDQLLGVATGRLVCEACGQADMRVDPVVDDEVDWNDPILCQACRQPISRERLEALPQATNCAACQTKEDTQGGLEEEREYCPRCGSEMNLAPRVRQGITRYYYRCEQCRR